MGKLVEWLDIRLAEDGLENVFKEYVPQFMWLEEKNFEELAETDVLEYLELSTIFHEDYEDFSHDDSRSHR